MHLLEKINCTGLGIFIFILLLEKKYSGLLCQDSGTVDKQEGSHNSKLRSSKRNKVLTSDHEKENRLDLSNLNSKSNRTGTLRSKSDAKSIDKSTQVFSEHQRVKRK
jgi:topoisomerase (DNA) II binding protein 1